MDGGGGGGSDSGSGSSRSNKGQQHGDSSFNRNNNMNNGNYHGMNVAMKQGPGRPTDFPLRILVLSEMVGAIIGREGTTIRQITQDSRARVDVHRRENAGSMEKVITIYGNPDNCSKACSKILEVMAKEAQNTNRSEGIPLKILAHNNLIGRIIGKCGNTIKRIMDETTTKITVSTNIYDVNSYNLERVITIKGKSEDICKAEHMISSKLKQCYESDLAAMAPQTLMFPGLHPMAMMSTLSHNYPPNRASNMGPNASYGPGNGGPGPGGGGGMFAGGPNPSIPHMVPGYNSSPSSVLNHGPNIPVSMQQDQVKETVFLYIPNTAVGAIIGTGGSTIRDMISSSGATIKVAQPSKDGGGSTGSSTGSPSGGVQEDSSPSSLSSSNAQSNLSPQVQGLSQPDRKVTILGTPEAQWKAQFMIFRKVGYEGLSGPHEAILKVEIRVPSTQVGRIIGKGGSTVRELQRITHAIIKLPEESQSSAEDENQETPVHIIGDFLSTQAAQRQIRALVIRGFYPSGGGQRSGGKGKSSPSSSHPQNHLEGPANSNENKEMGLSGEVIGI